MTPIPLVTEIRTCLWCDKTFVVGGRSALPRIQRYCSKSCSNQGRSKRPEVFPLSVGEAAYLGGIIDGEGNITVYQRGDCHRRTIRLNVVNTHFPLLAWCQAITGVGAIVSKRLELPHHTPSWAWQVGGAANAVAILEAVRPYLIVKRAKADAAITEMRTRLERSVMYGPGAPKQENTA